MKNKEFLERLSDVGKGLLLILCSALIITLAVGVVLDFLGSIEGNRLPDGYKWFVFTGITILFIIQSIFTKNENEFGVTATLISLFGLTIYALTKGLIFIADLSVNTFGKTTTLNALAVMAALVIVPFLVVITFQLGVAAYREGKNKWQWLIEPIKNNKKE